MELKPIPGVKILGFGHKARHGKDTAVDGITTFFGKRAKRFAFADALKTYCRINHGMTVKDGALLQKVGVDMRKHDPLFWVKLTYWAIDEMRPEVAIISDVRFKNEAEVIKGFGGTLVNVTRYNSDGSMFLDPNRDSTHISEVDMDDYKYDIYLRNDKGAGDLQVNAQQMFYDLFG